MASPAGKSSLIHYLNRLTNLNNRNTSIFLGRISQKYLDLGSLLTKTPKGLSDDVYHLWKNNKAMELVKVNESQNTIEQAFADRLQKLKDLTNLIYEESGSWNLNLGYPMVRGIIAKDNGKMAVHAPLMLKQVKLEKVGKSWQLLPKDNEPAEINKSLLLALANYKNINVSSDLLDLTTNDLGSETSEPLTDLHNAMAEVQEISEFLYLLNAEIKPFQQFNKADFLKAFEFDSFQYTGEAVVGLYQQVDQYLMNDYKLLIDSGIETVSEIFQGLNTFEETPKEESGEIVTKIKLLEVEKVIPLAIDSSQEQVLDRVKQGESLVVQGPPGTGKSQLIANLASDFLARGKSVLIVCQKKAALDVVKHRLEELQIGTYLGLIEDFTADRVKLYAQLNTNAEKQNQVLDSLFQDTAVEDSFIQISSEIENSLSEFAQFKNALFQINESGISAKELYLIAQRKKPKFNLELAFNNWPIPVFRKAWEQLQYYFINQKSIANTNFWFSRNNLANIKGSELTTSINQNFQVLLKWVPILGTEPIANNSIFELLVSTSDRHSEFNLPVLNALWRNSESQDKLSIWLNEVKKYWSAKLHNELDAKQIEILSTHLAYLNQTHNTGFSSQMERLFDPAFYEALDFIESYGHSLLELDSTTKQLTQRKQFQELLQNCPIGIGSEWLNAAIGAHFLEKLQAYYQDHLNYVLEIERNEHFNKLLPSFTGNGIESCLSYFKQVLIELHTSYYNVDYLNETQWKLIENEAFELPTIVSDWNTASIAIQSADRVIDGSSEATNDLLSIIGTFYLDYSIEALYQNLIESLAFYWLEKIESNSPVLQLPSSPSFEALENGLQKKIVEKQALSAKLLQNRLAKSVNNNWNKLSDQSKKKHFVSRLLLKRRVWPIRKLFENFEEEVASLLPCLLMTPDMVSAIMPLKKNSFDLVIFDEASQCFSERGLPAVYRAKQLVVAGDDKQLQPFDLGRIRLVADNENDDESDADETVALEAKSLLELCRQYLRSDMLKSHYRSRSADLIAFSNKQFYEGKLITIPHFQTVQNEVKGIVWVPVQGIFTDSRNHEEAEKAIQIVFELLKSGEESIGIVSFNAAQQEYIADLLRWRANQEQVSLPLSLFVKNIENVQGDERDHIILSITYAKDKEGIFRKHFGDLSLAGGENKLNVAITRAKKQVFVISSLRSGDIGSEKLTNAGPKLLEAYINYAQSVGEGRSLNIDYENIGRNSGFILADKLMAENPSLNQNLSFADLTVEENGKLQSILFTDDYLYFNKTTKEAHGYFPLMLKQKGWNFKNQYTRNWWAS